MQIPAEQRYLWTRGQSWAPTGPFVFTLEDGTLSLLPTPATSGYTLRMRYYASPNRLDLVSNCASIRSVSGDGTYIELMSAAPAAIATNDYFDVIKGSGMFPVLFPDRVGTVSGVDIDDVSSPIDGDEIQAQGSRTQQRLDYVARAGRTPYPPIPESTWPLLVGLTCRAYCEAVGDMRGMEAASAMYERKRASALNIMQPRVDGEVPRPIPLNTPLRGGRRFSGRGW